MKKMRFTLRLTSGATIVAAVVAACSVFEAPPSSKGKDPQQTDNSGGSSGRDAGSPMGSGGAAGGSTATGGMGGGEAGAGTTMTGGGAGHGATAGSSSGTAGQMSGGGSGGAEDSGGPPSGPTEAWWPHKTADGCDSAGVPKDGDRVKSDPGGSINPLYFAMNHFRLGAVDDAPDPMHPGL